MMVIVETALARVTGLLLSETSGQWQSTSACREQKSDADADGKGQLAASAILHALPVVDASSHPVALVESTVAPLFLQ